MSKLWKRDPADSGPHKLQEMDLSKVVIDKPTVIYLSGFMTTNNKPQYVSGGLKCIEELLQGRPELATPPEIYTWSYTNLRNVFNLVAYNFKPHKAYSPPAEKFARGVIMPLVSDKEGKPLPAEEAHKRLRNLTLFGYSAGTMAAQEIFNASLQLMQDIGYKKEDAMKALQEVVLIATGNTSRPSKEKNRFTTLYLAASNDIAVRWKNHLSTPLRALFVRYANQLTIKPLSDTSLFITAAVKKKMWEWRITREGGKEKKKIEPLLPAWALIKTGHELPHYITNDDEHNQFSKIVLNALINALNRKEKLGVMQLLEPAVPLPAEELAAYREKIAKAVVIRKKR